MRAVAQGWLSPGRLLLLPSALHRPAPAGVRGSAARGLARAIAPAGPLGARSVTRAMVRAELVGSGARPQLRTLAAAARTAMLESDERSNAWRRVLATWQTEEFRELIDGYRAVRCPTLLLCCSDEAVVAPRAAQEAADLIDDALLRTLPGTARCSPTTIRSASPARSRRSCGRRVRRREGRSTRPPRARRRCAAR